MQSHPDARPPESEVSSEGAIYDPKEESKKKNTFTRTFAASALGATLAVGGAALSVVPAHAAELWIPGETSDVRLTPGSAAQIDLRLKYTGTATTISDVDFTITAPSAMQFKPRTPTGYWGTAGYMRVNEQFTTTPTFAKCDYVSPTKIHCFGPLLDAAGRTVTTQVPLNPNNNLLIRVDALVPVGSYGPAHQPIPATGTVTTAAGTQAVTATSTATVSPETILPLTVTGANGETGAYTRSTALSNGTPHPGPSGATFSAPVKSVTYTATITAGSGGAVANEFLTAKNIDWAAQNPFTFSNAAASYSITKISDTQVQVTKTLNTPATKVTYELPGWYNAVPNSQATISWNTLDATPAVSNVSETIAGEPNLTETVTWGTIVDIPVISPAVGGIALLGVAGAGGAVFASRRKKAAAKTAV